MYIRLCFITNIHYQVVFALGVHLSSRLVLKRSYKDCFFARHRHRILSIKSVSLNATTPSAMLF